MYLHALSTNHPLLDQDNLGEFYLEVLNQLIGKPSMLDKTAQLLWENSVYRVNQAYPLNETFSNKHITVIEQVRNNRRVLSNN